MAVSRQKELREGRKLDFLYDFNLSGKAEGLKEKLKKSIVDVIHDSLVKKVALTGLVDTDKDKLLSEAFAYLVEQMQVSVEEVVKENKESFHEDIVIPWEHAYRERELFLINAPKENIDDKLLRLANEYEIQGKIQKANEFHKERACRDRKNISIWMDFTRFCLRNGDISHAEEYIKEILSLNENSVEHLVLLGSLLLQRRRFQEAAFFLHQAVEKDFYHVIGNLVLSLLYKFTNKPGLEKRYSSIAKRLCMRHLGLLQPKRGVKSNFNPSLENSFFRVETQAGEYSKSLTLDQVDDMYYFLTDYFLKEKLVFLAGKALEEVCNKETSLSRHIFYKSQILFWTKNYSECAETLQDLLKLDPKHEAAWILQGNALYFMNNHFDAEESYLKAVRSSNRGKTLISSARSGTHISDYSILLRLGTIYLKRRAWTDAKLVFNKCCEENPTSTSWTMLGLSCLYLNELNEAEEALTEGNIMDEQNPINWASLALLCAKRTDKLPGRLAQFLTSMNLAVTFDLNDVYLMQNIAQEYIRIIVIGDYDDLRLLNHILVITANALRQQGKDVSDLRKFVEEAFAAQKEKFQSKKRRIDEICEKVMKSIS
jgi:tetratricopeptide (TPR) repeat protein